MIVGETLDQPRLQRRQISLSECVHSMYRHRKQRHNTAKLPKLLRDELVLLGKLEPQKGGNKYSQGGRYDKKPFTSRGPSKFSVKGGISRPLQQQKSRHVQRSFQDSDVADSLDEDDLRINELEKKIGMGKEKKSKVEDDGLDGLLDGIGILKRSTKRKNEFETKSPKKYQITQPDDERDLSSEDSDAEESEFEGFSDRSDSPEPTPSVPVIPSGKYIPPAARKAQLGNTPQEQDPRLQKQLQGVLNRLSESNLSTILSEIESLYRNHPRASVTSILTNILLTILMAQHSLLDTFVILHAGFVAALYRLIGIDFAAFLVQTLIEQFDKVFRDQGRDSINLVVFLTELYNFGVVGAALVYDLIRMFLEDLNEFDTELLMKIVQNSGQQLRQDDPSALKDIVILMQSRIAELDQATLSVRTKFMIETIINLKNNRAKAATSSSVVTSEATIRMKKFLGKMGEKGLRSGGEPLRVTLDDIRKVKEKGKWWLVGASWKNDDLPLQSNDSSQQENDALLTLAREQRMNTEIRRAVFIALMGSEDYIDASTRILLLPLKKAQRNEIPRVLVHCCSNESVYNPFYALVARRLCSPSSPPQVSRVVRMGLQFNLWSAFREWGENTDDAEWAEEQEDMLDDAGKLRKSVNLAKLYGSLVAEGVLSLQILKVLGFINLQPLTKTFLEVFFTQLVLHSQGDDCTSRNTEPLLQCAYKLVDSAALAKGIDWYLRKKNVERAGLSSGEAKSCVVWGIDIIRKGIAEVLEGQ